MAVTEGVTITYQGKLCGAVFDYNRPVGLEPGFGSVFVGIEEFKDYKVDEGLSGVDSSKDQGALQNSAKQTSMAFDAAAGGFVASDAPPGVREQFQLAAAAASGAAIPKTVERTPTNLRGWQSVGDLVFSETILTGPAPGTHAVTWKKVLLTERAVESAFAFDDENDVCRVEITDIRYLWAKRGVVFGWVNVPKNAAGLPAEPDAGSSNLSTVSSPAGVGGSDLFILGSTNNGRPWTLREVLEQKVLPNLPGAPRINYIPPDVADQSPLGHIWNGVLAKKALDDLLKEFQLELSLDLDSNISLWKKGDGAGVDKVKLASGSTINVDPTSANCDPRVATAKLLVSYKWVPSSVVVLGPPIIVTERMKLEAVGEIRGQVVKLKDALESIGLTMDKAQAFALARYSDRTALPFGVTIDGVREFDRWAFKWFRIPGGAEQNADKLPILDARGSVNHLGQLHPVKVFSETHSVVNIFATKLGALSANIVKQQLRSSGRLGASASDKEAAAEKARALLQQADPRGYLVTHNIPFAEQSEGWEIDHARGIVKFRNVQGLCVKDGVDLESFAALLAPSAAVELEFCHTLKPKFDQDITSDHCYKSVWTRGAGGAASRTNDIPPGSAPLTIDRLDLQEVHDADGKSNKATLDQLAQKLAEAVFRVPQNQQGAIVTLGRPVDVQCSGQVLNVRCFMDQDRPRTEVHISSHPLMSPNAELRTLAFGLPMIGRGRALDSVFAPRGATQ